MEAAVLLLRCCGFVAELLGRLSPSSNLSKGADRHMARHSVPNLLKIGPFTFAAL